MPRLAFACALLALAAFVAGQTLTPSSTSAPPLDYVCPMHRDIRSAVSGKCPRCGMTLIPSIRELVEYPLELSLAPRAPRAGEAAGLTFRVRDPKTGAPVTEFETVHEKRFHLFIVSQDLEYFAHEHPAREGGGAFRYTARLPNPGMYRVLADYFPSRGTPQLTVKTIFVAGGSLKTAIIEPDLAAKRSENMNVELATEPARPIAGSKTLLLARISPADGFEQYLGAWGHMLAASDDLIDLIHTHPFLADGGPEIEFSVIFPRARMYRLWIQFQRKGVVNTSVFTIPVAVLE